MTICNRCGGVVSAQAKICPHCGALIGEAAGNPGSMMGARKRAEVRERAPLPPTFDPFAAFPAAPFPGTTSQPFGAGIPDASSGAGRWQGPSSQGAEQLPDWLRPSTSELDRRPGMPGQSFQPRSGNDPFGQRSNQGAAPAAGPLGGVPPVSAPLPPAAQPPLGGSPYRSGGRNATDDLFAASSLWEQNKLPEWLRSRQESGQASGQASGLSSTSSKAPPAAQPRPAPLSGADPFASSSVSEDLPDWLRAMDPGAPPPSMSGRFGSAVPRAQPGAAGSLGSSQASAFGAPTRDPFSSSRIAPSPFGASPSAGADPFAGRSPLGQPLESRPRPFGTTGPQGGPPAGLPPPAPAPFGPASSLGHSPFGPASGPLGGGSPASGSPFSRPREPGASPFGAAPAPGALPFGAERAPGASMFAMPASGSPFGPASGPPFDAASAFDAFAPRSAPPGAPPASHEPALPFGERFAAGSPESADLPDWLRIREEEPRPARPGVPPSSAPLHWPAPAAFPSSAPSYRPPDLPAPPGSAPAYRPAERISPFAPSAEAPLSMPAPGQSFTSSGGAAQPSAITPLPPSPFDASSLIDEAALPGWLSGGTGQTEPLPLPITVAESVTGSKSGERPAADSQSQGAGRSAEHEEDLPDWLRQVYTEARVPALEAPAAEGAAPASPSASSGVPQAEVSSVFNASDLLDQHAVPDWLREAAQTSPLPSVEAPAQAAATKERPGAQPPGEVMLSAQSLLDESSLPEWLRKIEADGPPAPFKSPLPTTGGLPAGTTSGIFSAAELIDTQALPAWLKTGSEKAAPSGAAPAAPTPAAASGQSSGVFSAAELVDTQMLPAWLKAAGEEGGSDSIPAAAPEGASLGSTSGVFSPAELIDTQALPAWLKAEGKRTEGEQASSTAEPSVPSGADSGVFSAAELVDTQALPAWLRQEGSAPAAPAGDARSESLSKLSPLPSGFAKQQTGSFSAAELVDTQSLPAWLQGAADPSASLPPTTPVQSGPLPARESERFSAAELIDTQALPAWMKNGEAAGPLSSPESPRSGGQGETGSASGGLSADAAAPGTGFSAPELIDPQALPAWLQTATPAGGAEPPTSAPSSQPAQPPRSDLPKTGSLSGASLIDRGELPEWLQGQGNFERPGASSAGGEGEETPQARVPRRPRLSTEVNRAPSQAAASVFSSVLGPVAGEDRSQGSGAGRGTSQQAPRGGAAQRGQGGQPAGARKGGEPGNRAPGGSAQPLEGWESHAPGGAASGDLSSARRMPPASEGRQDWEALQGQWPSSGQGVGRAGSPPARDQWPESAQQPQWRDLPHQSAQPGGPRHYDEGGWEGGPEMPLGYMEDEEVGPPSGIFAKIKRVLGFKR